MNVSKVTFLVDQIRNLLDQVQAETGDEASAPASANSAGWTNGMSAPDRYGRVKLEAVEAFRAARGADFLAANRPIPERYFVQEALTTFPDLNPFQRHHILSNIGDNANRGFAGRDGGAVKFEQRGDSLVELGLFTSEDPDGNTMSTKGRTASAAAQEVIHRLATELSYEQEHGGPGGVDFGPNNRRNGG